MPLIIAVILSVALCIIIVFAKYDGSNDLIKYETEHLGLAFGKVTSFINKWVAITALGQIKQIDFEQINNEDIIFHNSTVTGIGYNTQITLKSTDVIWQVIPNSADSSHSCKILGDFRNNKLLMENPKFIENYFGAYYCSILYNGVFETNALYYAGDDYALVGTDSDGVFSCTFTYGTTSTPPSTPTLSIFASGSVDYERSTNNPIVCKTVSENGAENTLYTSNQNETFTFYRSKDGSCTSKHDSFSYSDIDAVDINNDNEIYVIAPRKNKAPTLEDKTPTETITIFVSGSVDYERSSDSPTICQTLIQDTNESSVYSSNQMETFTFYRSNDGTCTSKNDTFSYDDIEEVDVNNNNEIYVVEPTKNKAPTIEDK